MVAAKRGSGRKVATSAMSVNRPKPIGNASSSPDRQTTKDTTSITPLASPVASSTASEAVVDTPFKEHKFVPPRSKEFYRVGPEFKRTCQNFQLSDPSGNPLYTIISARIDRGFQKKDDDSWLSYRRNYFTLSASFSIVEKDNVELGRVPPCPVHVSHGNLTSRVHSFAIRLTAFRICSNGESEEIPLIQHTAKRDKGPREPPAIVPAVPGVLPDHDFMRDNANYRSSAQLRKVEPFFYRSKSLLGPFTEKYATEKVAHVVLFDRIQFTTAGGGGSQVCKASVQLIVTLEDAVSYVVAWCETPPFTLRNRSPANYYKDGTLIPRTRKGFPETSPAKRLKSSFVAERPDLKVSKITEGMFTFDSTKSNAATVHEKMEYKDLSFAGFRAPENTSTFSEGHPESGRKPESKLELEFEPKDDTLPDAGLARRKRGKPKTITKSKKKADAGMDGPDNPGPAKREGKGRRNVDAVKVETTKLTQRTRSQSRRIKESQVLSTNISVKEAPEKGVQSQPAEYNFPLKEQVEGPDSDSDELEESEEEMRKRDFMRLRTGSTHLGAGARPGLTSTATSPATLPSFDFMSQSSIGRARPSASRDTYTPATGNNGGDGPVAYYTTNEREMQHAE